MFALMVKEYEKDSAAHILDLHSRFVQLSMKTGKYSTFSSFVASLEQLSAQLESRKEAPSESLKLNILLGAMPDHARFTVASIRRQSNVTFQSAKDDLAAYFDMFELDRARNPPPLDANPAFHGERPSRWCSECRSSTHTNKTCFKLHPELKGRKKDDKKKDKGKGKGKQSSSSSENPRCRYCKGDQLVEDCPKPGCLQSKFKRESGSQKPAPAPQSSLPFSHGSSSSSLPFSGPQANFGYFMGDASTQQANTVQMLDPEFLEVKEAHVLKADERPRVDSSVLADSACQANLFTDQECSEWLSKESLSRPIGVKGCGSGVVTHRGIVRVNVLVQGKVVQREFSAYYAPFLRHSLLSVGRLQREERFSVSVSEHTEDAPSVWTFSKGGRSAVRSS